MDLIDHIVKIFSTVFRREVSARSQVQDSRLRSGELRRGRQDSRSVFRGIKSGSQIPELERSVIRHLFSDL